MQIEMMNVADLAPYANNPRKNNKAVDVVAASIREFGFRVPITVDNANVIVTGHTRLKAALQLGLQEVPVIRLTDLSPDKVKAFRLVDNKAGEIAKWDLEALAIELQEIDMDMSQFTFEIPESFEVEEDDFVIKVPSTPVSKSGEVYRLGEHLLMCGDATSREDVNTLMGGGLADLLIIDPPYNVDYEGAAGKLIGDNQPEAQFQEFLTRLFTASDASLKPGGPFYIWHADGASGLQFREACRATGWQVRQCLVWNKSGFVLGRQDYQWKHEPCLYGWKDGAAHYFTDDRTLTTVIETGIDIDKLKLSEARALLKKLLGPKVPCTVINEDRPKRNDEHPTQKPVRIIAQMVLNSSRPGAIVADFVAGSGTLMVAAERTNRKARLMEIDPRWVDVIIARYEKLTGNKAVRIK